MEKIKVDAKQKTEVVKMLSNMTPGFSGADLENVCNEAAIGAAREACSLVTKKHFDTALDRIRFGLQQKEILEGEKRTRVASYEAGKAVASWFLDTLAPVIKLSILETAKTKTQKSTYLGKDQSLQFRKEIEERIVFYLSGRAAEIVIGIE